MAALILRDSAHLHERDAEMANREGFTRHRPALPLYDTADAERAIAAFVRVRPHQPTALPGGAEARLRRTGHILGAASVELAWGGRRMVVSGDLGRYDDPVMLDPEPVPEADLLAVESTYGGRLHDRADPAEALGAIIERTVARGGTVVIPAFAVGRAQLLLRHLWRLRQAGRLAGLPIYLDSPMAIDASDMLAAHPHEHRLSPAESRRTCRVAEYVRDSDGSRALSASGAPKVIVSASGMATGGRVLHHIRAFGPDPRSTLLFSGFQAAGTRGRALLEGAREVRIHGRWIPIAAEVRELPALSAHADAGEIVRWLRGFRRPPGRVLITHGEPQASEALRVRLDRELGWTASAPLPGERFEI